MLWTPECKQQRQLLKKWRGGARLSTLSSRVQRQHNLRSSMRVLL